MNTICDRLWAVRKLELELEKKYPEEQYHNVVIPIQERLGEIARDLDTTLDDIIALYCNYISGVEKNKRGRA